MSAGNSKSSGIAATVRKRKSLGSCRGVRISCALGIGQDESPLSERWDIGVIRIRLQPGLFQRLHDRPIRLPREHRRRALNNNHAIRSDVFRQQPIESRRIKFAERVVGGIRKVDNGEIEHIRALFEPGKGVGIDDV